MTPASTCPQQRGPSWHISSLRVGTWGRSKALMPGVRAPMAQRTHKHVAMPGEGRAWHTWAEAPSQVPWWEKHLCSAILLQLGGWPGSLRGRPPSPPDSPRPPPALWAHPSSKLRAWQNQAWLGEPRVMLWGTPAAPEAVCPPAGFFPPAPLPPELGRRPRARLCRGFSAAVISAHAPTRPCQLNGQTRAHEGL